MKKELGIERWKLQIAERFARFGDESVTKAPWFRRPLPPTTD
jgi:hypothetical protein